jgi:hypothetical protein
MACCRGPETASIRVDGTASIRAGRYGLPGSAKFVLIVMVILN